MENGDFGGDLRVRLLVGRAMLAWSGLVSMEPRALPWAGMRRPVGAGDWYVVPRWGWGTFFVPQARDYEGHDGIA